MKNAAITALEVAARPLTFNQRLQAQNRLRYRAALLAARADEIAQLPGQWLRAWRIATRAHRCDRRADRILHTLSVY